MMGGAARLKASSRTRWRRGFRREVKPMELPTPGQALRRRIRCGVTIKARILSSRSTRHNRASVNRGARTAHMFVHPGDRKSGHLELYCFVRLYALSLVRALDDRLTGDGVHAVADETRSATLNQRRKLPLTIAPSCVKSNARHSDWRASPMSRQETTA